MKILKIPATDKLILQKIKSIILYNGVILKFNLHAIRYRFVSNIYITSLCEYGDYERYNKIFNLLYLIRGIK